MNKGWRNIILFLLAILVVFGIFNRLFRPPGSPDCSFEDRKSPSELIYTNHARCRMGCRFIDRDLVERVYQYGDVNCEKSGPNKGDMRYALELEDDKGEMIRVIIEDEDDKHIVITVIRLRFDDQCDCS